MDAHLVVRWAHVAAAAIVVGGPLVLALAPAVGAGTAHVARRAEWAFWAAFGVLVATGVGNLGAIGRSLPDSETR